MAKGNEILVSANPRGVFMEGIIDGALLPGTVVQIKAATAMVGGRPTFEVYNTSADGKATIGPLLILLPDHLQGKTATDAYVDGDRCFAYCPVAGEEFNMLWAAAGTGTGDAVAIGDLAMLDDGTGLLIDNSSGDRTPFQALEALTDVVAAGTLCWVIFTGQN